MDDTGVLEKEVIETDYSNELFNLGLRLKELDDLNVVNKSGMDFIKWFTEVINKNIAIYKSKRDKNATDHERYKKPSGNVYFIDFGKTIGSEFQSLHFCVVLYELDYTALVAPMTSKKETPPHWVSNTNLIVDIGAVQGLPKNGNLVYIGGLQEVSKKRLDLYKKQNIKLSAEQMELIMDTMHKNIR